MPKIYMEDGYYLIDDWKYVKQCQWCATRQEIESGYGAYVKARFDMERINDTDELEDYWTIGQKYWQEGDFVYLRYIWAHKDHHRFIPVREENTV